MVVSVNCLGIDATYVGGVKTYALGVLNGFRKLNSTDHFRVYVTSANRFLFEHLAASDKFQLIVVGHDSLRLKQSMSRAALVLGSRSFFRSVSNAAFADLCTLMTQNSDVLYTPTVVLPFFSSRCPTVLSMHDIQHRTFPEFFDWVRRFSREITYGLSAEHASYIQASSQFIKNDLLSNFGNLRDEQIEVIHEGVDVELFSSSPMAKLTHYQLPDEFLFYPAQLWPHKNHGLILRSLLKLKKEAGIDIPIVLTGAAYSAARSVLRFVEENSMHSVYYLGRVPDAELITLYHRAAFLINASLHESSSLPVLEAAAAGLPIIASNIEAHRELSNRLVINFFDPYDEAELCRLLAKLWSDRGAIRQQIDTNRKEVISYSWEHVANRYRELFTRIVLSN